jgi:hypothetical protein
MAMSTSSLSGQIRVKLDDLEILGPDSTSKVEGARTEKVWVRCYLTFDNLPGEEVIDVPVIVDSSYDDLAKVQDRAIYVNRFDEHVIRSLLVAAFDQIDGQSKDKVFEQIDAIGYSDTA